ncbi:MAG: HAD-IA family hydrolase [Anaerolineales bacterium]
MNPVKVILTDLDGVIRHWNSGVLHRKEASLGLKSGHLFSISFEKTLLSQVITGKISDNQWRGLVQARLSNQIGELLSNELVAAWTDSTVRIDKIILKIYKAHFPKAKVFLTTNATTRLNQDLSSHGLDGLFDGIFNSSELGAAKPDKAYFKEVMKRLRLTSEYIIYVDDSAANVQAAQHLGIKSHLYQDHARLTTFLSEMKQIAPG